MEQIRIDEQLYLDGFREADKTAIAEYLNDKDIYEVTLRLPFPYQESDAEAFIAGALAFEAEHTIRRNWAIRHQESGLIGSIGLLFLDGLNSHRNEFGYWLGKPFWNQGMMTRVIDVFSRYCMAQFKYKRLQATVDPRNPASARILEKNGFSYEGTLKNYNLKKGQLLDVMMYAIYHQ